MMGLSKGRPPGCRTRPGTCQPRRAGHPAVEGVGRRERRDRRHARRGPRPRPGFVDVEDPLPAQPSSRPPRTGPTIVAARRPRPTAPSRRPACRGETRVMIAILCGVISATSNPEDAGDVSLDAGGQAAEEGGQCETARPSTKTGLGEGLPASVTHRMGVRESRRWSPRTPFTSASEARRPAPGWRSTRSCRPPGS